MKVTFQLPRNCEARVTYKDTTLIVEPKFFARQGSPVVAMLVVEDANGDELQRYSLKTSTHGRLQLAVMNEIKPNCDLSDGETGSEDEEDDEDEEYQ